MESFILLGQCFGLEREYKRALFMIMSFLTYHKESNYTIVLFTDNTDFFTSRLPNNINIKFEFLSPERIKQMRGPNDFLHRMKIAMIEYTLTNYPKKLFYVDSDAFFINSPQKVINYVNEDNASMHKIEYAFKTIINGGKTFAEFAELIANQKFKLASTDVLLNVGLDQYSWNAGIMSFHPSHIRYIPDVYELTEQFYPPTKNHASEQYAFSVILQNNTQLIQCEDIVFHYWHRVEKQIMDSILNKLFVESFFSTTYEAQLSKIKILTEKLPEQIKQNKLMLQDNAIQYFCKKEYNKAYKETIKAIFKGALIDTAFLKDVLYHTKQILINVKNN